MSYLEDLFSLQGKVALITGATRGLGRAIAAALLGGGATVVLNGSNRERLAETARQFAVEGFPAVEYACDLSDAEHARADWPDGCNHRAPPKRILAATRMRR